MYHQQVLFYDCILLLKCCPHLLCGKVQNNLVALSPEEPYFLKTNSVVSAAATNLSTRVLGLMAAELMTKVKNEGSIPGRVIYTCTTPFRSAYVTTLTSLVTRYCPWVSNTGLQTFVLHFCCKCYCH
jgi:hypothetical protein